jgi:uncharacterized protein involved in type VI secretion and phage assembly
MQDMSFFGGFGGTTSRLRDRNIFGVVVGIVTDNVHPEGDYRVRVKFPTLPSSEGDDAKGSSQNKDQSWWARIVTFGAFKDGAGAFFLPEVDSEVLVAFMNGDFNQPIVIGTVWNGIEKPAYSNKEGTSPTNRYQSNDAKFKLKSEAKKNDVRGISTRKKHELVFNDNATEPGVVLSSGQKHRIVLNDKDNQPTQIEIYDGKEENYILIDNKNKKITIETKTGDMLLKAKNTIRLEAKTIETKSDQDTQMQVGKNFEMKASSNMTLKASGQGNVESSGTMTIKGSTVNIN